jgi:hypothetical protein
MSSVLYTERLIANGGRRSFPVEIYFENQGPYMND